MNIFKNLKYEYFSFDVFDTILYRKVDNPKAIFDLTEKKLIEKDKKYKGFANLRISAEQKVHKSSKIEATIYDIYELIDEYTKEEKELALQVEIETEKENLVPNLLLKQKIENLRLENKKIVIISDMYLTKKIIEDLLNFNEIKFDYLFVSSDIQLRKRNGTIFDYVIKKLKIDKKNIVHIGDNIISDYIMPRLKGIKSILWKKIEYNHSKKFLKLKNKDYEQLYEFVNAKKHLDFYEEIGYKYFGPVLYGFCKWIKEKITEYKLDEICFLSRDGQIVKKAYSIIYKEEHPYLLVSRRALTVPLLYDAKNMSEILSIVPYIKRNEEIPDFLKKLGIENIKLEKELEIEYGKVISRDLLLSDKGKNLFDDIQANMKENAIKERETVKKYISQNIEKGKIGLVDIGWYGTMQRSMEKICNLFKIENNFYGLYFGLLPKKQLAELKNAHGYIYDYKTIQNFDDRYIYGFNGLIELMFTANHGSAKKYVFDGKNVVCELEENKGEYSDFVQKVQKGALDFITDLVNSKKQLKIDNYSFVGLEDLLINPTIEECYLLGKLKFYDVYFENIIQFNGWFDFIKSPNKNIKNFLKSNWKIGYIKEMFKVKNPKKIYYILNKIK